MPVNFNIAANQRLPDPQAALKGRALRLQSDALEQDIEMAPQIEARQQYEAETDRMGEETDAEKLKREASAEDWEALQSIAFSGKSAFHETNDPELAAQAMQSKAIAMGFPEEQAAQFAYDDGSITSIVSDYQPWIDLQNSQKETKPNSVREYEYAKAQAEAGDGEDPGSYRQFVARQASLGRAPSIASIVTPILQKVAQSGRKSLTPGEEEVLRFQERMSIEEKLFASMFGADVSSLGSEPPPNEQADVNIPDKAQVTMAFLQEFGNMPAGPEREEAVKQFIKEVNDEFGIELDPREMGYLLNMFINSEREEAMDSVPPIPFEPPR
jgi:hypothetical protein